MAWIEKVDRTVGAMVAAARWLVLPVALEKFPEKAPPPE
jgi:hypothetical protein